MKLLFLFAVQIFYGVKSNQLILQKCCPQQFAFDRQTEKCEYAGNNLGLDWIPNQVKKQKILNNRAFRLSVPLLEEFDFRFSPCPYFLEGNKKPFYVSSSTYVQLQPIQSASLFANNQSYDQWCFEKVRGKQNLGEQWVVLSCTCLHEICIPRCCKGGHVHSNKHKASVMAFQNMCADEVASDWDPATAADLALSKDNQKPWLIRAVTVEEYKVNCIHSGRNNYSITRRSKELRNFEIDAVGNLKSERYFANRWTYCLTEADVHGTIMTVALLCDTTEFAISFDDAYTQSILAGVGAAFTLLTLFIHVMVKDLRHGIKGVSLIAHCACVLGAYLTMALRPLVWADESDACTLLGVFTHFFLLSAFYWLNVRAIIIYATFRSWNSVLSGLSMKTRSFPAYALYALGVPVFISGFMAWVQFTDEDDLPYWIVWPDLDEAACWFRSPLGRAVYFSLPMGIVLILNICLFVITLIKILAFKKENANILKSKHSTNTIKESLQFDMEKMKLFAKLSLLMGLTYVSEFVSWINYISSYYWYASNVAIAFRAVLIFVVFCCNRKVWSSLGEQYPAAKRLYGRTASRFRSCKCCNKRKFQTQKLDEIESSSKLTSVSGVKSTGSGESLEMIRLT
ncbi:G-protein coupled receptor Mth-like [Cloeon dipterum]|uniref:G-protein coupled receptor Mth-like n=1 Tax=Cloeon dipterum TaxID=197152 RepID=UPI0032203680